MTVPVSQKEVVGSGKLLLSGGGVSSVGSHWQNYPQPWFRTTRSLSAADEAIVAEAREINVSATLRIRALLLWVAMCLRTLYSYILNGYAWSIGETVVGNTQTVAATPSLETASVVLKAAEPEFITYTLDLCITAASGGLDTD